MPHHIHVRRALISFPSPQKTSVVKHVLAGGVKCPVVAFSRISRLPWNFHKAVIEREVVSNAVLPSGEFFSEIGKSVHNELTYTGKCESFSGRLENGHGNKSYV